MGSPKNIGARPSERAGRASHRARILGLGHSASIAIALSGCSPNCLNPDEQGTVVAVSQRKGAIVEAVKFKLSDGTTRTCFANEAITSILAPGDKFKGRLGGGASDLGWRGEQ